MSRAPDFRELVGDVAPAEEERLRRVHELLVAAGPPAELPPELATPVNPLAPEAPGARRGGNRLAWLLAAALLAIVAFVGGYNSRADRFQAAWAAPLTPTAAAPGATARIEVGKKSGANWPMRVTVDGLPKLARNEEYAVYLTRHGKIVEFCGYFSVTGGRAERVSMNAPQDIAGAGWIVTRKQRGGLKPGRIVLKTKVV